MAKIRPCKIRTSTDTISRIKSSYMVKVKSQELPLVWTIKKKVAEKEAVIGRSSRNLADAGGGPKRGGRERSGRVCSIRPAAA